MHGVERLKLVGPIESAELLNSAAEEVSEEEITLPKTQHVIDELFRIAAGKDEEGGAQMVGLAAPQVGVGKRIAIVDINATGMREKQQMQVLINPRIVEMSDDVVDGREGCWSCGSYCANVPRASRIVVEALDRGGKPISLELEGFTARIVQHEIDHLNGIRCIDRVPEGEDWRLHRVNIHDAEEFNRYRTEWPHWNKTFPRSEWKQFHDGRELDAKITGEIMGEYRVFTAERNGAVAGSVKVALSAIHEPELARAYPGVPVVYQLFTDPKFRSQGIGTRLMDVAEEAAQQQGAQEIMLGVVEDNAIARKMYEARGYEYALVGDRKSVDSVWDIDGRTEVVQVMPMIKKFQELA